MAGRKGGRSKRRSTRGKPRSYGRGILEVNPRGFGFVKTSTGEFFIPRSKLGGAFDGDVVEIAPTPKEAKKSFREKKADQQGGMRREARVVNVCQRAHECLVGRYEVAEPFGMVVPLDPRIPYDIFTQRSKNPTIADESIVRVRITEYPSKKTAACGVIEEVLGDAGDTKLLIENVIASHKLRTTFPEDVQTAAKQAHVGVQEALRDGYKDIRSRFVFTIDPTDARDFDDALSIEPVSGEQAPSQAAWCLGVHIADVSRYVPFGSALDLEARERATSVYLPDRVIPMLPEELSNGICSLVPQEDRLCMTVDMYLSASFQLIEADIYPAVMRSDARLDYEQALTLLENKTCSLTVSDELRETLCSKLRVADEIARARQKLRSKKGGLEFSTKEARVMLDAEGNPTGIDVREKTRSTELIEEAMIFANETVAQYLSFKEYPCAYRDHEPPPADSIAGLLPVLQEFSWFTKDMGQRLSVADPYAIQAILAACKGRREETLVSTLLLRTMSRAVYSLENLGHYGLGLDWYCHFTSPIRRYPDLLVHRMVRFAWQKNQKEAARHKETMATACTHCSTAERTAESASVDANKTLMCIYMQDFIGKQFNATISGVQGYGLYVSLENCAEGLVPVRSLGDEYFTFDPIRCTLTGTDSQIEYRLGDALRVRLQSADPLLGRLTFALS